MKIYRNIVIRRVPVFSLQNNAWRDKQASLAPHSCQNAFAFLREEKKKKEKKTCPYSPSAKPATIMSCCYDRKQIKHLSHSVPNEPLNYNLEIDSGHSGDYWSSKCLSQRSCQEVNGGARMRHVGFSAVCNTGPQRLQRHQIHSDSEAFKLFQPSRCRVQFRAYSSTGFLCMGEIVNFTAGMILGRWGREGFQNGQPTARSWNGVITAKQWAAGARRLSGPIRVLARREAGASKARTSARAKTNPPALLRGFLKVRHRCHSKELLFRPHRSDHSAVFFTV